MPWLIFICYTLLPATGQYGVNQHKYAHVGASEFLCSVRARYLL